MSRPRWKRFGAFVAAAVVPLVLVSTTASARTGQPAASGTVRSVVVLGDSVAAGEGARDGYVYQDRAFLPTWSTPRRASPARTASCGRTDQSYGVLVAGALDATVTNLACSGASFERGIALDARYEQARPDLVLVTAGANSVAFERAFAYCVLSARGVSENEADRVASAPTMREAVVTAVELAARRVFGSSAPTRRPACTEANPGSYLQRTVFDRVDEVGAAARSLASEIRARGRAVGAAPEVIFTTYANPLPAAAASFAECPDAAGLQPAQLAFLNDMFDRLNDGLRSALADAPGVRVVDPDAAFVGHRWCDADPWVYGPSIFVADPSSRVPFHPTPAGQRAFAAAVLAARSGDASGRSGLV